MERNLGGRVIEHDLAKTAPTLSISIGLPVRSIRSSTTTRIINKRPRCQTN